jgi:formylglycine-generating enzyme required for sulfatase activity
VFLAMIGPAWADVRNDAGARRLDDPKDWVRIELETALATPGLQIVPVLVNGAPMPRVDQLPDSLRRLPALNAAVVRRDPDFHKDMDKLIRALEAGAASGRVEVEAPQAALAGSAAAWKLIEDSLDVHDYADFQTHFPGTPEVILAGRRRRLLEAWNALDQNDPHAIVAFRKTLFDSGFERLLKHSENLMNNAQRRVREREAAEAKARREAQEEARSREAERRPERLRPGAVWRGAIPGLPESASPEMVTIPPGKFLMGAPASEEHSREDERPQHGVQIGYTFALGKHPVTFAEWDAAIEAGAKLKEPDDQGWGRGRRPVINVSWNDAKAYIEWLNTEAGLDGQPDAYRLPSEAEWEYACRAGTTTPFSCGATISTKQANFDGTSAYSKATFREKTTPVGSFPANAFGLHDMHGNVWEWCEDVLNDCYAGAPTDGSAWLTGDASRRVLRGGSWDNYPNQLRSAFRYGSNSIYSVNEWGFRLARTI